VRTLDPPYNVIEPYHGEHLMIRPARFALGEGVNPRGIAPPGTRVPLLRVWHLPPDHGAEDAYWDFPQLRLIALLPPLLAEIAGSGAVVHILASGEPPRIEYTITLEPA